MRDNGAPVSSRQRLIESLWQDARREAQQENQKARSEAEHIREETRRFQEGEMARAAETARNEALPHVSRVLNQARNRARRLVLEERLAFLDSCFDEVSERIGQDEDFLKEARSAFENLLSQALSAMGDPGKIEASLNPADLSSARGTFEEKGIAHDLTGEGSISGGVLLRVRGGSMIVDDTIEGRLKILREAPPIDLLRLISLNQDR